MSQHQQLFLQIQVELGKIERAVQTNTKLVAALDSVEKDSDAYEGIVGGIAMNLQSAPAGTQWHQDLLTHMIEAFENRPAVLSANTAKDLQPLLGFRHVVRNAYSYTLDAERVLENADRLLGCFTNFAYDCLALQCALSDGVDSE